MNTLLKLAQLHFIPRSHDLALLALRVWLGTSMLCLHGWAKVTGFSQMAEKFADPFGIGPTASLALAVFGEALGSVLLVIGLFGRFAALTGIVTMSVAFFLVHKASLESGPGSGELAFIYLAGYIALFLAGPGRFALDTNLGVKKSPTN